MTKLKSYVKESLLSESNPHSTHYSKLLSDIDKEEKLYQGIDICRYDRMRKLVFGNYDLAIACISKAIEHRFANITECPIFKNLIRLLDVSTWSTDNFDFGDSCILELPDANSE